MLINFSLENWMSFRDKTEFTMVATREQQHGDRLTKLPKYRFRALPTAAIYGGNASGKTNFFKAINFAKNYITKGVLPDSSINIDPFLLDKDKKLSTSFTFEILVDTDIYELQFSVTPTKVLEERLTKISSTSEKILYHRISDSNEPNLHSSIKSKRLEFVFEGTRDNQLFLTNSVFQKIDTFKPVFSWFAQTLELVAPDTRFGAFEHFITESSKLYETMNVILPNLDTGIHHLGGEDVSMESLALPEALKQKLIEDVKEGGAIKINNDDEKIIITRLDNEIKVKKLYTYHRNNLGKSTRFEMRQESDGSKRIIDLLPAFLDLSSTKIPKVYIIDEIERNLHSVLVRQLLEVFLSNRTDKSRNQLMFTTHNLLLMDQSLLRRDEMWITERDTQGRSVLKSFSEFEDLRNDKDLLKDYIQGRMGGIPNIHVESIYSNRIRESEGEVKK